MNLKSILNTIANCSFVIGIIVAVISSTVATIGLLTDYWIFDINEHKFRFLIMIVFIWSSIGSITKVIKNLLYPERSHY